MTKNSRFTVSFGKSYLGQGIWIHITLGGLSIPNF